MKLTAAVSVLVAASLALTACSSGNDDRYVEPIKDVTSTNYIVLYPLTDPDRIIIPQNDSPFCIYFDEEEPAEVCPDVERVNTFLVWDDEEYSEVEDPGSIRRNEALEYLYFYGGIDWLLKKHKAKIVAHNKRHAKSMAQRYKTRIPMKNGTPFYNPPKSAQPLPTRTLRNQPSPSTNPLPTRKAESPRTSAPAPAPAPKVKTCVARNKSGACIRYA